MTGTGLEDEMAELTAELILGWRLEMMFLTRPESEPEEVTRRVMGREMVTGRDRETRGETETGRELVEIALPDPAACRSLT